MNRVVTTAAAAAAAASALLSAMGARDARAQLVYDSFNYTAASPLENKVNPINGQPWSTMSANAADDDIVLSGGSLSYGGLAASSGNSVGFGGVGKSQRLGLDTTVHSGQLYYSFVLRVSDIAALTTTPTFIAGFSDRAGASGLQPTTVGTRLYLRKRPSPAASPNMFQVGVSKNSGFDISFDDPTEYAVDTPLLIVGGYEIVGTGSGTNDVAKLYINPTSLGSASAPTTSTPSSPILTAPVTGTDLAVSGVPSLGGFVLRQGSSAATTVPNVQIDELRIDNAWARVTAPTGVTWNVDNGGVWSDGAKWSTLASPNSPDAFVNFGGNITGPKTVDLDSPVALRMITFASSQPYTLGAGGGTGALNFSASAGINVRNGSHTIAAPIALGGEMLISVATGASLNLTGDFAGGLNAIIKAGDGALTVKHLRGGATDIVAGKVTIAANGSSAATSRVTSLSIGPDATLDLKNNKLLTNSPIGTFSGGAYTGVQGDVARAYDFGSWDLPGIMTSMPDAGPAVGLTTIGVSDGASILFLGPTETGTFAGQPVTGATTIAMYTYAGDVNFDGLVDAADYGIIDNYFQFPGTSGYANGDFNYDGIIDAGDYGIIDNTFQLQGAPIPIGAGAAGLLGVTAVPEPSGCVAALMTIAGVLARRRR